MKFHHLIWIEVVGHVNAFQNHSFLKIKTMRTGMANSTPLEREVPKLSLWQVPKLQQSWQAFNNVKCQAIVQDILLLEKYLNMIMNLDTFSLSPSPSRDIHPQIIPGTCMMKLPCVVTVQWARRPPIASPKVHLWNPHSRRAAIATTILLQTDDIWPTCGKKTYIKWWCEVETSKMPIIIMRHPVMKPTKI